MNKNKGENFWVLLSLLILKIILLFSLLYIFINFHIKQGHKNIGEEKNCFLEKKEISYECKVLNIENNFEMISSMENIFTLGLKKKGRTKREVILDCGEHGRKRIEHKTLLKDETYNLEESFWKTSCINKN